MGVRTPPAANAPYRVGVWTPPAANAPYRVGTRTPPAAALHAQATPTQATTSIVISKPTKILGSRIVLELAVMTNHTTPSRNPVFLTLDIMCDFYF